MKGEVLNEYDPFTAAIWQNGGMVEHSPESLSKVNSFFLHYDGNVAFFEATGGGVNC